MISIDDSWPLGTRLYYLTARFDRAYSKIAEVLLKEWPNHRARRVRSTILWRERRRLRMLRVELAQLGEQLDALDAAWEAQQGAESQTESQRQRSGG